MATALKILLPDSLREQFGSVRISSRKRAPEFLITGLGDIALPRGTLTEVSGPASSGRTGLFHAALARSTRRPEFCALIDASDSFDPLSAEQAGVLLPRLLWLRSGGDAEKALKATDLVVQAGGFGLVVLDLASIPVRQARRISLASWFRLRHAVEITQAALLVVSAEHCTASCSTLHIENEATGFEMKDGLLLGLSVKASLGPRQRTHSTYGLKPPYQG
jgi:hypothetical protein